MKGNGSGALYGMGLIGALIYYIQNATSIGMGMVGIVKALFWPAVVVYEVFSMLSF